MHCNEINQSFERFYRSLGHETLPSASLLDPSIPMSFVMSAGLVQIERVLRDRTVDNGDRYVLIQRCFRHFDLARIGVSNTHLTLFEMPGAFVFGPNRKADAVKNMWRLLTDVLGLPKDRLWVSYFDGGNAAGRGFDRDAVTRQAWLDQGVDPERLLANGPEQNLWLQGGGINDLEQFRKCGPNTEVFYDRGQQLACGPDCRPGCPCGRFVEVANTLFVSHEMDSETGQFRSMSLPFCETVIGTERVAMVSQGRSSVYEIETIAPLMRLVSQSAHSSRLNGPQDEKARRILVDHVRATCYLVADGAPGPGKNGRQRIMRKLIRSALTQQSLLSLAESCVVDALLPMIDAIAHQTNGSGASTRSLEAAQRCFADEATKFSMTITRAQKRLDEWLSEADCGRLSGKAIVAFEKNTGMPVELIQQALITRRVAYSDEDYMTALIDWQDQAVERSHHGRLQQ